MRRGAVYICSDGRYVGDADVWERFESEVWRPCCWDTETGYEWVETNDGELLLLVPVARSFLPDWMHVEQDADGIRVGDAEMTADR